MIQTQQNTFVLFTLFKLISDEHKTLTKISTCKTSHNHSPNQRTFQTRRNKKTSKQPNKEKKEEKAVCSNMSSNGRITRSKGPADGVSLPPITRPKKGTSTEAETEKSMTTQHQADGQGDQLGNPVEQASPFARLGLRAGARTAPSYTTEVPLASSNPFAQRGSREGSAQLDSASTQPGPQAVQFPNASGSPASSISGCMFPEDINTSGSWDLIDLRCDAEVAGITGEQNQQPVDQPVNTSYDSTQANPNQGLPQVNQGSLNQHLGTLHNQDFFVMDIMGRRLSQIPDKSSYPYLLPNGHSALQLRLPDLLIYLKTDTYLIDVHTGHHYAVYSDRIEKMSILLKLYSTWEYKQLLWTIQNDAMHFGVNSPQPTTSEVLCCSTVVV